MDTHEVAVEGDGHPAMAFDGPDHAAGLPVRWLSLLSGSLPLRGRSGGASRLLRSRHLPASPGPLRLPGHCDEVLTRLGPRDGTAGYGRSHRQSSGSSGRPRQPRIGGSG